jgi:DNA-binding MarR family transcriptional regulator
MTKEETTKQPQPNDKEALMDRGGYEIFNRNVMRKVFPRIFKDANDFYRSEGIKRKPQIRDITTFYFLMLSYVNGNETLENGEKNDRFGACYLTYEQIIDHLHIDGPRVIWLARILEENGLIRKKKGYHGTKRYVLYFPSFASRVTEDGYLIDKERGANHAEIY